MTHVATPRRSFWAWCLQERGTRRSSSATSSHRGSPSERARRSWPSRSRSSTPPRCVLLASRSPTHSRRGARPTRGSARPMHTARTSPTALAPSRRVPEPARRRRAPVDRSRARGDRRLVRQQWLRRRAVRRRQLGRVGRQPSRGRRHRDDRGRPPRQGARDRRRVARRAHSKRVCSAPTSKTSCVPHGYTLRHFPQSFRFSSLGGWIATAVRRPLRDEPDAHRRLRRVGSDAHPSRLVGVAPVAGERRGSVTRPDGDRQRGDPRHHQ